MLALHTETMAYNYNDMLTIWVKVTKKSKSYSAVAQHPIKRNKYARATHSIKEKAIEEAVRKVTMQK
ncbi:MULTISPECIES: hypothetical protein [Bacillaceae]|uniref:AP2-like integrase N-terminal domain-containing protein n=1 Tax=Metabacillus sediminis TaxID=3117746 RepID=A0ABZ2NMS6_9BACI|nr:hypothetical protein [Bacillus sp. SJS]KZZ83060.1 hypothetical protein AS29_019935 [Bacillus sp. SJS]